MNSKILLQTARDSIRYALMHGKALPVLLSDYAAEFQEKRASFVTLHLHHHLRGCIGTLEAWRSLIVDVAENAYAAAFEDPRFAPLSAEEFPDLEISISILSPSEPIVFSSEEDLLQKIRPGIDGLILNEARRRSTFLPAVWENLPNPKDFLEQLKLKAGLPENYWSDSLQVSRYTVQEIKE